VTTMRRAAIVVHLRRLQVCLTSPPTAILFWPAIGDFEGRRGRKFDQMYMEEISTCSRSVDSENHGDVRV
jgi:hypothetical protein